MVALQKDNALNSRPEYVVFALVFILFGLAIVAASLNLLVSRHLSVMIHASTNMKIHKNVSFYRYLDLLQ